MPQSVLDAIKLGLWDYEPPEVDSMEFTASDAMPGSREKLEILAERLRVGLPLWHPSDRDDADNSPRPADRRRHRAQCVAPAVPPASA